jgi:hypothetical protein
VDPHLSYVYTKIIRQNHLPKGLRKSDKKGLRKKIEDKTRNNFYSKKEFYHETSLSINCTTMHKREIFAPTKKDVANK